MIDPRIDALSSQLAKMTPQQRQQFAMLHKNDPIAVSMAKYVSDQENSLRNSLKAQQSPQALAAKPPVVDEMIAGLAAMPTNVAPPDGGIAGMPPAQQQQPIQMQAAAAGYSGATGSYVSDEDQVPNIYDNPTTPSSQPFFSMKLLRKALKDRDMQDLSDAGYQLTPQQMMPSGPSPDAPEKLPQAPVDVVPNATPDPSTGGLSALAAQAAPAASSGGGGGGGLSVPSMASVGGGGSSAPPGSSIGLPADVDPMQVLHGYQNGSPLQDPLSGQRDQLTAREVQDAQDARDRLKQDQDSMGIAGLDREARLNKQQAKLDAKEAQNPGMAIFEAGLAMMASKSPYALQGIGEGALAGTKAYREGQKAIDEGREKLDNAFGQLEDLRRGEQRTNMKDLRDANANINAAMTQGVARTLDGLEKAYGYNREDAKEGLKAVMENLKSKYALYGEAYKADQTSAATRYAADQGLRGSMYHSNAIMQDAKLRASAVNNEMKMYQVQENVRSHIENEVAKARAEATKNMQPWTPSMEAAVRQRALANMPPQLRQFTGIAGLQPGAAPQRDTSQIKFMGTE